MNLYRLLHALIMNRKLTKKYCKFTIEFLLFSMYFMYNWALRCADVSITLKW